ncbi:sulfurtransferase [Salipaludibacillus sp. HK11]|uniref:sulfurtransferase n=1 Tax=Salipaludibacillus sp. HK11 TaxID=3394320 RepID=UPI0039FDD5AB
MLQRYTRIFLTGLVSVVGLSALAACAEDSSETSNSSMEHEQVVDVDWLENEMEDENLLILDARGADDYEAGHIPSAINTPWQQFAHMGDEPGTENWGVLLTEEELSERLSEIGISDDRQIVIYTDPNGWGEDGRIMWMLDMIGLTDVKMLDGGWTAWETADGEVSDVPTKSTPSDFEVTSMDHSSFATTEYLAENMDDLKIIDTRSLTEYEGATDFGERRGGHIPGASHLYFKEFFNDDSTLKSEEEMVEIMDELGIAKDDTIVTYCTAGIRSAHMTMLLKMAGYENVMNYDASIYEWAGNEDLPLE